MPIILTCAHCARSYSVIPSARDRKYCSLRCYKAAGKIETTCEYCGAGFVAFKSQATKYCSKQCYDAVRSNPPAEIICQNCGGSFLASAYKIKNNERRFCCMACHNAYMRGQQSPAWRGGWRSYYGPDWQAARRAARKRAGYRCQRCGAHQKDLPRALAVHHTIPVRCFATPNDAHHASNLVALCDPCHSIVERAGYNDAPLFGI